jgi:hypothetical protein
MREFDDHVRVRLSMSAVLATLTIVTTVMIAALAAQRLLVRDRELAAHRRAACTRPLPKPEVGVIRVALEGLARPAERLVVSEQTTLDGSPFIGWPTPSPFDAGEEAWTDYLNRNDEPRCLESWRADGPAIKVLRRGDLPHVRPPGGFWEWFYQSTGVRQLYRVSRVGFSRDGAEAILAIGMSCGGLCGRGEVVRLKWNGERWTVVERRPTWVS